MEMLNVIAISKSAVAHTSKQQKRRWVERRLWRRHDPLRQRRSGGASILEVLNRHMALGPPGPS